MNFPINPIIGQEYNIANKTWIFNGKGWEAKSTTIEQDYENLSNKPSINSVTLEGNKTAAQLGLATAAQGAKADTALQSLPAGTVIDPDYNQFTDEEKNKLQGIAENANNYSHPTGDGNKHVPANGTTNAGKVLTAGATAGDYTWETPASTTPADNSISNSQLTQVPTQTIKGRTTAGAGNVEDLTPAQALAVIGARPISYQGEFKTVIATMGSGVQTYIIPKSTITEFNAPMPTNSSMSFRINAGNTANPSEVLTGEMWQSIVYIRTGADITGVSFSQPNGTLIFGTLIMQSSTTYKFTWDAIRVSPTAIKVYLTINKV